MLDSTRLRAELFFIHRALSVLAATRCKNLLDDLRTEATGTSALLIWQALYADCLRVAHCAATADGELYELEVEGMQDFLLAAARHYTGTPFSSYGDRTPTDRASARTFLSHYGVDSGPFGRNATTPWWGFALCSRAAAAGDSEPLDRYARLMWWLIEAACQISEVSLADPRWRDKLREIEDLRKKLTGAGFGPQPENDRRIQVFMSKARVFAPVEQAHAVSELDPFDVEALHGDARASFQQLVKDAATEARQASGGRTLLVVGGAGSGKTHLLRSFWSHVQDHGRGFVAYAQLYANVDDYTRYLLNHLVDALERPYSGADGQHTGLYQLASGVAQMIGPDFVAKVERLTEIPGAHRAALDRHVNHLVDEALTHPKLGGFDVDLLRAMIYALCVDPKATPRVARYLRCEDMNEYDRHLIGDITPRTASEAPKSMLRNLARLAYVTRAAVLVLMIDQAELSGTDSSHAVAAFQRAVDALLGIVSEVHSSVAVIACLSNLYDTAVKAISSPTLDRLLKDPPPVRLSNNRSYDEIKAIVSRRLAWLFAEAGAVYRAGEPVYPIPPHQLAQLVNRRPRDVLDWCQQFRDRCVVAGKIVEHAVVPELPPIPDPPRPPPPPPPLPLDQIAAAWSDACRAPVSELDGADVVALVTAAVESYAVENGLSLTVTPTKDNMVRVQLAKDEQHAELVVALTNRSPHGGGFGTQIGTLRKAARGAIPVAVRTLEFPSGAVSLDTVRQLTESGGRTSLLDRITLQTLVAHRRFQPPFAAEHVAAWRRRDRPISSLPGIAAMFMLAPPVQDGETVDRSSKRAAPRARAARR